MDAFAINHFIVRCALPIRDWLKETVVFTTITESNIIHALWYEVNAFITSIFHKIIPLQIRHIHKALAMGHHSGNEDILHPRRATSSHSSFFHKFP
jgi:hypothetical protein